MPFRPAGPAAILRGAQKDELFAERLRSDMSDLLQQVAGNRVWMKYRKAAEVAADLLYYSLTTLSLNQTLGEEYTGIVEVAAGQRKLPPRWRLGLMVLLHSVGPVATNHLLAKASQWLNGEVARQKLRPEARHFLQDMVETAKSSYPYMWRLHLALFYLTGTYYHISKRVTGVRYVMVRDWFGQPTGTLGFHILGWLSLAHVALTALYSTWSWWSRHRIATPTHSASSKSTLYKTAPSSDSVPDYLRRCSLCLENRRSTTATPCGHLFCWECICQWLRTKHECPLCREKVMPSRVIFLFNYDRSS